MKHIDNQMTKNDSQYDAGMKALVKALKGAFFLLVVVILGMLIYFVSLGGYFTVTPQESVIVLRFGKYVNTFNDGWHWYFPFPVHRFVHIKTNSQSLNVDFTPMEITQGSPEMRARGRELAPGRDRYLITGDDNIIHTSWQLAFEIENPRKYYETVLTPTDPLQPDQMIKTPTGENMGTRGPQTLLRALLRDAVVKTSAKNSIVNILYKNKERYQEQVKAYFIKAVNDINIGVKITEVNLGDVSPPLRTKPAFAAVSSAENIKSSMIDKAKAYSINQNNIAIAQKAKIIADANVYKKEIVAEVKADSNYFKKINAEYQKNPGTVLVALYNDKLSSVLSNVEDKYIFNGGNNKHQEIRLKINPEPIRTKKKSTARQ
jgi:membrane protease subunit HflK